ncbi:hypothetical protein DZF04_21670 [Salmonella enterica]|uniref:Uncharacterized protein n=1 Tax=Salmonella senftenberg TaxID=28150 RepID=A0A3V7C0R5_SALSE|nr:hypothetical protein C6648_12750 [Salmonella enterica]AWE23475.1 hypothetical protein A1D48_03220 [Salmonella enterica subsp. enterica serovar Senftenberg]AWE37112.1 hypothetical protein AV984_03220 [Salmonella enterica subsp. enterica serovar Senftenberg str. 361154004]EAB7601466.1 hypothetical protein [Salmonella enterica subsp. enterica serovar Kentucky]EBF1860889.1 hypothetical protein [Salmonella enterica subsp. enterica serovar Heidelberg]EBH8704467.1 hypothetical protein [Salmonella 
MTVHDAIPKRKRLIGQFHLFIKTVSVSWRVYAFTGRQDEWLSTTLYPKESGLSVSFTSS